MTDKYKDSQWLKEKYIDEGWSYKDIADECGVSKSTVGYHARNCDFSTRERDDVKYSDKPYRDENWLREQYIDNGRTLSEIAEECDVVRETVANWCRKHDIEIQYPTGEDHPQYNEDSGKYPDGTNFGGSWEENRRKALERANYACENPQCNEDKESLGRNPDVHHIIPFRLHESYDGEIHSLENLVVLCRSCHIETEPIRDVSLSAAEDEAVVDIVTKSRGGV